MDQQSGCLAEIGNGCVTVITAAILIAFIVLVSFSWW